MSEPSLHLTSGTHCLKTEPGEFNTTVIYFNLFSADGH